MRDAEVQWASEERKRPAFGDGDKNCRCLQEKGGKVANELPQESAMDDAKIVPSGTIKGRSRRWREKGITRSKKSSDQRGSGQIITAFADVR